MLFDVFDVAAWFIIPDDLLPRDCFLLRLVPL
jgi:hypothetical protein